MKIEKIKIIAKSIKEFGFLDPVGIDEDNYVIEGKGRVLAGRLLGLSEIPCVRLNGLTETQKRAYIIAHNKLTLNTDFDMDQLEYELNALKLEDFNLDLTGFSEFEINDLLDKSEDEILEIEETEEKEEKKEVGYICPCCSHKGKKIEFLEVDLNG